MFFMEYEEMSCPYRNRQKCVDRGKCHRHPRRDHRRWRNCGRRRGGDQGCAVHDSGGRCSGKDHQNNSVQRGEKRMKRILALALKFTFLLGDPVIAALNRDEKHDWY